MILEKADRISKEKNFQERKFWTGLKSLSTFTFSKSETKKQNLDTKRWVLNWIFTQL